MKHFPFLKVDNNERNPCLIVLYSSSSVFQYLTTCTVLDNCKNASSINLMCSCNTLPFHSLRASTIETSWPLRYEEKNVSSSYTQRHNDSFVFCRAFIPPSLFLPSFALLFGSFFLYITYLFSLSLYFSIFIMYCFFLYLWHSTNINRMPGAIL